MKQKMTRQEFRDSSTHVDVTEDVEVYQNGKAFSCDCGQDIGVCHNIKSVKCASCGNVCVDTRYDEREAPEIESEQTTLGSW